MIKQLTEKPISFGWVQDGKPVDIIGADNFGVKVKGKTIMWNNIKIEQMMKFYDYYFTREDIRISERGRQSLAVAILFHETNEAVRKETYLNKALNYYPNLKNDTQHLMSD